MNIKFRIFKPLNKKMHYVNLAFMDRNGNFILPPNKQRLSGKYTVTNLDAVIKMQFTGLEDNSEKKQELYKDDVVRVSGEEPLWKCEDIFLDEYNWSIVGKVVMHNFSWALQIGKNDHVYFSELSEVYGDLKVEKIGNIHENPELLEKE